MVGSLSNSTEWIVTVILWELCLLVPAVVVLQSIPHAGKHVTHSENPTPYGYTISLILYIIPDIFMIAYLTVATYRANRATLPTIEGPRIMEKNGGVSWNALAGTILIGTVCGYVLDVFFCYNWFEYPNKDATLRVHIPAYDIRNGSWVKGYIPIEEFVFYLIGVAFNTMVYVFADTQLCQSTHVSAATLAKRLNSSTHSEGKSCVWWPAVIAALVLYAIGFIVAPQGQIPGYWIFITTTSVLSQAFLMPVAKDRLNYPALMVATVGIFLIAIIYEPTLGLPYEWWGFKPDHMLGIYLKPWSKMPIEELYLYATTAWFTSEAYEYLRAADEKRRARRAQQ